ncbi:hypothetical protein HanRHA438_Chr04g0161491 [Helianthus annuus]|nr:hypothetical protein HanRHA438_Chr04g0161491 [Helianthus annuus]
MSTAAAPPYMAAAMMFSGDNGGIVSTNFQLRSEARVVRFSIQVMFGAESFGSGSCSDLGNVWFEWF